MIRTMNVNNENERVYLDWAAATPLSKNALEAMMLFLESNFGNPSAIHSEGVVARNAVENARDMVARSLHVRPEFVTFTGGGTEGNNLSIFGTIEARYKSGVSYSDMVMITTKIEHPSISRTAVKLGSLGVVVMYVDVDEFGFVKLEHLRKLMSEKTVLVSVAYANSEIGVVQSTRIIRKIMREAERKYESEIYLHVDAAQAPLWLSCQFDTVDADFLVLDAAKCCGPKGVGLLVRSRRSKLFATSFGGGQEQGLRPGTENVSGIVGAGVAIAEAQKGWNERAELVRSIRDQAIILLLKQIPTAVINGPSGKERLANNINISIGGLDTEFATIVLDSKGFAVSTKSACSGASGGESVVVKTTTNDSVRALSTLRITIGPDTFLSELQRLIEVLKHHVEITQN